MSPHPDSHTTHIHKTSYFNVLSTGNTTVRQNGCSSLPALPGALTVKNNAGLNLRLAFGLTQPSVPCLSPLYSLLSPQHHSGFSDTSYRMWGRNILFISEHIATAANEIQCQGTLGCQHSGAGMRLTDIWWTEAHMRLNTLPGHRAASSP